MDVAIAETTPFLPETLQWPDPAPPPEVTVAMAAGVDRLPIRDALVRGGWSVSVVDDGWTLLARLAGALMSGGAWKPPALVVLHVAVAGPGVALLLVRIEGFFPGQPVLLVGESGCASVDGPAGLSLLRAPFQAGRVVAAADRARRRR